MLPKRRISAIRRKIGIPVNCCSKMGTNVLGLMRMTVYSCLIQLEDDIMTKPGYLSTMKNFALNQKTDEWMLLEFSHLGFIGR